MQFKVWSHVAHKLETWTLMSYVRSEGEDLMATLLEPKLREVLREHPTRGWGVINSTVFPTYGVCSGEREDEIGDDCEYPTKVEFPELEGDATEQLDAANAHLARLVADHIGGIDLDDPLNGVGASTEIPDKITTRGELDAAFNALTNVRSAAWEHLPETMLIRVNAGGEQLLFTVLANRIYENHERVYQESLDRSPADDTLTVERGIIGHYPGLFVDLPLEDVGIFLNAVAAVKSKGDWARIALSERIGEGGTVIDRRSPEFWTFLDDVHQAWFKEDSVEAAVLDVSEYVWPQDLQE
ncbi:MAG: fatty acid cis/trans isomerase [Myxococcota bacterium]